MYNALVLSSGGPIFLLYLYSIIKLLNKNNLWDLDNLKTIYGTSAGAITAILLCLNIPWDDLDEYIIKRPWSKILKLDNIIFESFNDKGFLSHELIEELFRPLFGAKQLSMDITLGEFYKFSNIDLRLFSTHVNTLTAVELSHISHPDLSVIKAIYMSAAIPYIFKPAIYNNELYIDGGLTVQYPCEKLLSFYNDIDLDNILGIYANQLTKTDINIDSNLINYTISISLNIIAELVSHQKNNGLLKHEINMQVPNPSIETIINILESQEKRIEYLKLGEEKAKEFLNNQN